MSRTHEEIVALIPAAGSARRLGRLPSSKEILPIGFRPGTRPADPEPKPVCLYLLESLARAGVRRALVILRPGKEDIPAALGASAGGVQLEYLTIHSSPSVPHTLLAAYPQVRGRRVALGFPDILFEPQEAFSDLVERQQASDSAIALGLFPTTRFWKTDMVRVGPSGRIEDIVIKPTESTLRYTWSIAIWKAEVTEFLRIFVDSRQKEAETVDELQIGEVLRAALREGFPSEAVVYPAGSYLDIGTPDDLEEARRRYGGGEGSLSRW